MHEHGFRTIQPDGLHPQRDFAAGGLARGYIFDLQDFRATESVKLDDSRHLIPPDSHEVWDFRWSPTASRVVASIPYDVPRERLDSKDICRRNVVYSSRVRAVRGRVAATDCCQLQHDLFSRRLAVGMRIPR